MLLQTVMMPRGVRTGEASSATDESMSLSCGIRLQAGLVTLKAALVRSISVSADCRSQSLLKLVMNEQITSSVSFPPVKQSRSSASTGTVTNGYLRCSPSTFFIPFGTSAAGLRIKESSHWSLSLEVQIYHVP